ncbi:MAG TPA: DUF5010 domain-containing protein [Thermoguttaceae bacterium]|nr:DUF5010 domain-containing protein [Thermoguttaceae bacterium]
MTASTLAAAFLSAAIGADPPDDFALSPPPGPFVEQSLEDASKTAPFAAGTPVIATTYFYWYDAATNLHVIDPDGTDALTDHPPTLEGFSYKSVDWHARQLDDMIAAGIDVAMPVYWGVPYTADTWSDQGLPKLVAARERLLQQGKNPPAIGMFYDTSTLAHNSRHWHVDLTTAAGQRWFYGTIRNFYSYIPARHRACIDGKPLVLLYSVEFAAGVDEKLFPAVRELFRADFGTDLYLVKMRGWPGEADSEYQWGGSIAPRILDTAGIGPGYDHSAVPGRKPLVRHREDGRFYEFAWQRLLGMDPATRPWLVHLETWNEFHEGTEICETAEYGRKYIELSRRYADRFHARERFDPAAGPPVPEVVAAAPAKFEGLHVVPKDDGDGPLVLRHVDGRTAWSTTRNRQSEVHRYMYFDADYAFLYDGNDSLELTVGYFDAGPESFVLQYDSCNPELNGLKQEFREGGRQEIEDSGTWKEVTFVIPHARFADRANECDFRLASQRSDLKISHVSLIRVSEKQGGSE